MLLPRNHLCDLIFHVTQCLPLQKQGNQSRDSWRLFQRKSRPVKCTFALLVTNSLQFINLPRLVFQSSPKSGTQSRRNWNSPQGISLRDNRRSNKKSKQIKIKASLNRIKTLESTLNFSTPDLFWMLKVESISF